MALIAELGNIIQALADTRFNVFGSRSSSASGIAPQGRPEATAMKEGEVTTAPETPPEAVAKAPHCEASPEPAEKKQKGPDPPAAQGRPEAEVEKGQEKVKPLVQEVEVLDVKFKPPNIIRCSCKPGLSGNLPSLRTHFVDGQGCRWHMLELWSGA